MLVKKITLIIALNAEMKPRPSLKSQLFDMSLNFLCGNYSIDVIIEKVLLSISVNRKLEIWRFSCEMKK